MSDQTPDLDLPAGWSYWLELENKDGACFGKAQLREGREIRCMFVLAQKPRREDVLKRLQFRADLFIGEWQVRVARGSAPSTAGPDG